MLPLALCGGAGGCDELLSEDEEEEESEEEEDESRNLVWRPPDGNFLVTPTSFLTAL